MSSKSHCCTPRWWWFIKLKAQVHPTLQWLQQLATDHALDMQVKQHHWTAVPECQLLINCDSVPWPRTQDTSVWSSTSYSQGKLSWQISLLLLKSLPKVKQTVSKQNTGRSTWQCNNPLYFKVVFIQIKLPKIFCKLWHMAMIHYVQIKYQNSYILLLLLLFG